MEKEVHQLKEEGMEKEGAMARLQREIEESGMVQRERDALQQENTQL